MTVRHRAAEDGPATDSVPQTTGPARFGPDQDDVGPGGVGRDSVGSGGVGRDSVGSGGADLAPTVEADDPLAAELARAEPRRWWNRATPWLAAAALLVGGFAAGAQVEKTYGPREPTGPAARGGAGYFTGRFGGGAPGGQPGGYPWSRDAVGGGSGPADGGAAQGGPSATGGTATSGTVKLVDGSTIYVQTESGEVITVRTNGGTVVQVPGKLSDLKPGDQVSVQGEAVGDGEVTAGVVSGRR